MATMEVVETSSSDRQSDIITVILHRQIAANLGKSSLSVRRHYVGGPMYITHGGDNGCCPHALSLEDSNTTVIRYPHIVSFFILYLYYITNFFQSQIFHTHQEKHNNQQSTQRETLLRGLRCRFV